MYQRVLSTFVLLITLLCSWTLFAAERPELMLEHVTEKLLTTMKENNSQLKNDPNYIFRLVDTILVPHVDTIDMARWVIGRLAWENASASEQTEFVKEFKRLVIRTYASTLNSYNNQKIDYLPIRGNIEGKSRVQVQSLIKEPGKEVVRVAYRLVQTEGAWRVYDIIIEGVSILKGFQSQFAPDIKTGGVAKAIKVIQTHNNKHK